MFLDEENIKGVVVMAVSKEENDLLRKFWDDNEKLIKAAFNSILNDIDNYDLSNEERETFSKLKNLSKNKKYRINNSEEIYCARKAVWKIVSEYIKKKPESSYEELYKIFPKEIQGGYGIIKKYDELTDNDKGMLRTNKQPYFFLEDSMLINTKGEIKIAACNQWGVSGPQTNFLEFKKLSKKLGYIITETR